MGDIGCIGAGCVPAHYQGRGAVRAGTRVFAAPGKGEWSSVAAAAEMAVVFDRGSEWIRISPDDITEECEPLSHGFVRAGDVRLPWQP